MVARVLEMRRENQQILQQLEDERRLLGLKSVEETIAELAKRPSSVELQNRKAPGLGQGQVMSRTRPRQG